MFEGPNALVNWRRFEGWGTNIRPLAKMLKAWLYVGVRVEPQLSVGALLEGVARPEPFEF